MSRRQTALIIGLACLAVSAFAAAPNFQLELDVQRPDVEFRIKRLFQGSTPTVRIDFFERSQKWNGLTNYGAFMWYGTNWLDSTSIVQIAATTISSNVATFRFSLAQSATNGTFLAGVTLTNASDTLTFRQGQVTFRRDPGGSGSALQLVNLPTGSTPTNVLAYHDGTQWVSLASGAGGQFLQTGSPTNAPTWATVAGSGDMLASVYDPIIAVISNRADGAETTNAAQQTTINTLTSQVAGAEITNAAQAVTIVALTATNAAQQTTIDALSTTQATQQTEIDANQLTNTTQQATLNTWTASSNLFLKLSGGTMSGNLNMGAQTISNAPTVTTGTNVTFFMKSAVNGTNSVYFTVGSTNQYHFLTPFN